MARGWSELPTLSDRDGAAYFFGVYASDLSPNQYAVFSSPTSSPMPATDNHPSDQYFGANRRGYTWAGYHGDAVVVSFDERADWPDAKFVFWSEANYIPWWHINDHVSLTYEFVEIWGGGTVGCNEPMSDHLLRWTRAKIIESNPARVVVQWDYTLITSNYQWWNSHPSIRPTVRETFTFYPDGVGVRKVTYRPPLEDKDTHHKWGHELGEIIVSFGGGKFSHDFLTTPSLSVFDLKDERHDYSWDTSKPTGNTWTHQTEGWPAVIIQSNFKKGLASPFIAFAQDERVHEFTSPTVPIQFGSDWELNAWPGPEEFTDDAGRLDLGGFSHWPVMKQPYDSRSWIGSTVLREPRHLSLISVLSGPGGYEWPVGPKKRTFAMLIGLNNDPQSGEANARKLTRSWIYPGRVSNVTTDFEFASFDYYERAIRFRATGESSRLQFTLTPEADIHHPVIIVEDWKLATQEVKVTINGTSLSKSKYAAAIENGRLILWLDTSIRQATSIQIE